MKQLTRKEIIELIEKELSCYGRRHISPKDMAIFILKALETNGILTLVEGNVEVGDIIRPMDGNIEDYRHITTDGESKYLSYDSKAMPEDIDFLPDKFEIIQRNSIPAYHCKPETQGAE